MSNCKTMNANNSSKLMPIKAAAEYLGVSTYFLRRGVKDGTIPFIRSGCKYYIAVDVIMDYVRQRQRCSDI